ncbi:aldo/keto reductase [Alphaproteobacteria bacterium]|nr:aldo/keto reductase [Alphaproteobacteria bacterium]
MKLALGTVQFGIDYGVANTKGKLDGGSVASLLAYAKAEGIDLLDTAAAYGTSESVLGNIGVSEWKCITKIAAMPSNVLNVEEWVAGQINLSLKNLKVPSVHGLLLHNPCDLLGKFGAEYLSTLLDIKKSGLFQNLGFSIYSPHQLEQLTKIYWPDIVQTPFNVFDQRIKESGWLEKLSIGGTKVHARSAFLQGLLLMDRDVRPSFFKKWSEQLSLWDAILKKHKIRPTDAALSYVMSQEHFEKVIVGVNSIQELYQLIQSEFRVIEELAGLSSSEIDLIEPFRWRLK